MILRATGAVALFVLLLPLSIDAWQTIGERRQASNAAGAHRQRAERAVSARDYMQGELALRAALDLTPRDAELRQQMMLTQALAVADNPARLDDAQANLPALRYTLTALGAYDASASHGSIYVAAGHLARRHGNAEAATTLYAEALKRDSNSAAAHLAIGAEHRRAGRTAEAIAAYEAAFAAAPDHLRVVNNLGVQYVDTGELQKGADMFEKAVAIADNERSRINLGNALVGLGRFDEAIEHLQRATSMAPQSSQAWGRLGGALLQAGRAQASVPAPSRSLTLQKDDTTALLLARAYQGNDRHDLAAQLLKGLLQTDPSDRRPAFDLGVSLEALGNPRGAATAYEQFLKATPTDERRAAEARARLAKLSR